MKNNPRSSNGRTQASDACYGGSSPSLGAKTCGNCHIEKTLDQFSRRRKNGHQSTCKTCSKEIAREHYRTNKDWYKQRNDRRRIRFQEIILLAKTVPCMDCKKTFAPVAMDFDHRQDKLFTIAQLSVVPSEKALREEIAKCDVVCSNCHRVRTANMWLRIASSNP